MRMAVGSIGGLLEPAELGDSGEEDEGEDEGEGEGKDEDEDDDDEILDREGSGDL
jgi:hypothetical protein